MHCDIYPVGLNEDLLRYINVQQKQSQLPKHCVNEVCLSVQFDDFVSLLL